MVSAPSQTNHYHHHNNNTNTNHTNTTTPTTGAPDRTPSTLGSNQDHKKTTTRNYYQVLGVSQDSTYDEIKAAFTRLARCHHPDKKQQRLRQQQQQLGTSKAESKDEVEAMGVGISALLKAHSSLLDDESEYREIQEAWETLRDRVRREIYNEELRQMALSAKTKESGAVPLSMADLEVAEDEDTGEILHVYDCRCGEEIILGASKGGGGGGPFLKAGTTVECPGCCFVYRLEEKGKEGKAP